MLKQATGATEQATTNQQGGWPEAVQLIGERRTPAGGAVSLTAAGTEVLDLTSGEMRASAGLGVLRTGAGGGASQMSSLCSMQRAGAWVGAGGGTQVQILRAPGRGGGETTGAVAGCETAAGA
jgi:hypothetical protein